MPRRSRLDAGDFECDQQPESPQPSRQFQPMRTTTPVVPRGQDRPRISVDRSRSRQENCPRDLRNNSDVEEETSPIYPQIASNRSLSACRTPYSTPSSSRSTTHATPVRTPVNTSQHVSHTNSRSSCCDHERQFEALQRKLVALTEKIDNLQRPEQPQEQNSTQKRTSESLPRDMVACVHKVVRKLKEKDPPTEWTFEPDHSFNDETNHEVMQAIERGVRAVSTFKEANPVLLERAIKTYFKTLKAKTKRISIHVRDERLPHVANKQDESVVNSRRNQRCHNKLKSRQQTLKETTYTETRKRKLEEVLTMDYMSPEESMYGSDEEGQEQPTLKKLVARGLEWRSQVLIREFQSLDRKAHRARSERGKRMMMAREQGGILPNSLHCYPKSAPAWALCARLQGEPN